MSTSGFLLHFSGLPNLTFTHHRCYWYNYNAEKENTYFNHEATFP